VPNLNLPSRRSLNAKSRGRIKLGRRGFTLVQMLVSIGIVGMLAVLILPVFARSRAAARRSDCDTRLKAITLALDTFRQENGKYPAKLKELVTRKYLSDDATLRCPGDPRAVGDFDPNDAMPNGSYEEYYVTRAPKNAVGLPLLVCPFHEEDSGHGTQAYSNRTTQQFATQPAVLVATNATFIQRPGKESISAIAGMKLRGGDRIRTASTGLATIRFADGSTCELQGNSDITVLQSFLEKNAAAVVYTLISQTKGDATYTVNHGSKFDVSTPTATAGALGTKFQITIGNDGVAEIKVLEGKVRIETRDKAALAQVADGVVSLVGNLVGTLGSLPPLIGGILGGLFGN